MTYSTDFPNLPHRSNYNRRRRRLKDKTAQIAPRVASLLETENQSIIIEMGVPIITGLTAGAQHDSQYLCAIPTTEIRDRELLGGKGYIYQSTA